ncbi:MAG: DUF1223 domain-containing protein [Pyrinomonadaceae bacterium]
MRLMLSFLAVLLSAMILSCATQAVEGLGTIEPGTAEPNPLNRHPVLVELFTSEGCSSCPPADRNLAFLEKQQPVAGAEIITLAFHVDYWDRLGWKDRFSSSLFSQRQGEYSQALKLDSNYTPQLIVDGEAEFVGSDSGKAAKEVLKAAGSAKALVEVAAEQGQLKVKILKAPDHRDATVYAAVAEDGISSRVERGENAGKTLEHISVVRELRALGAMPAGKEEAAFSATLQIVPEWKAANLKVVVFVQENDRRNVIGVGRAKFN